MTDSLTIREIADGDVSGVIALWQRAGLTRPWNDPAEDIAFARRGENSGILVGTIDGTLAAAVMAGHDGHRGTVYYLAVDPDQQGAGFGRQMMAAAEAWLRDKGVWKVNLMVRTGNAPVLGFYDTLGYQDSDVVVREKWLDPTRMPAGKRQG